MTPNDCILMLCVQLAETTNERDQARARVIELEQEKAQAAAQAANGACAVTEMQTVEAARG